MNLDNLKPAWRQFRFINAMQPIDENEILFIIREVDEQIKKKWSGLLVNTVMFIVLMLCCQGG